MEESESKTSADAAESMEWPEDRFGKIIVDTFMACDVAELYDGKLFVLGGGIDTITVPIPGRPFGLSFAVLIRVPSAMVGRRLSVAVGFPTAYDTTNLHASASTIAMLPGIEYPELRPYLRAAFPLRVVLQVFETREYEFDLVIDGRAYSTTSMLINASEPA